MMNNESNVFAAEKENIAVLITYKIVLITEVTYSRFKIFQLIFFAFNNLFLECFILVACFILSL